MTRQRWITGSIGVLTLAAAWMGCATSITRGGRGDGGAGGEEDWSSSYSVTGSVATGAPSSCSDASECHALDGPCVAGICVNGACETAPANEFQPCDDGMFCTEDDICVQGACTAGTPKFCPSLDSCHLGVCDEELKTCKNIVGNDGGQCDDDDSCTLVGVCSGGVCSKGSPIDCSVFNSQCTVGACDPEVGCYAKPANEGFTCSDGLFCTVQEKCQAGQCGGGIANPCAPPGGCYIASCDEGSDQCTAIPGNDGQPCDDLSACTEGTTCLNGACINGAPSNDGAACDDGTDCTTGEICSGGLCGGGIGPQVYFAENFADNAKGWTLGPEWGIGPAKLSIGGVQGADPDTDHTPTSDNGVAGVVIGGNASTNLHPYYYIESPTFDTSSAAGPVILGFYRWLNSDYDPFMHNIIEVWNGSKWVTLWTSGGAPGVQDSPPIGMGWTFIQHDLTAHKNAAMRVRFGFDVASGGVFTIGSWNIDDVLVAAAACP